MNIDCLAGLNLGDSSSIDPLTLCKASGPNQSPLTTLPEFVTLLAKSGIRGPHHLSGLCLDRRGRVLNGGKQFTVFVDKTQVLDGLVIKRINADLIDRPLLSLDLEDRRKNHLKTLWLEILALSHRPIQAHRNITKVHGWGFDYPTRDRKMALPVLFMERALCSLEDLLQRPDVYGIPDLSFAHRYHLCLDVLEGLICLHKAEIIHGDIKPANVLVFTTSDPDVPVVAKLNDFGMCIPLQQDNNVRYEHYMGTPKWLAPELREAHEASGTVHKNLLYKCEVFTFGLLVLSVFFASGNAPLNQDASSTKSDKELALQYLKEQTTGSSLDDHLMLKLHTLILHTLDADPNGRNELHRDMLATKSHEFNAWYIPL